jgi:hypothetical protein
VRLFVEYGAPWWSTSKTRLTLIYAKLDTASTTYVHCNITVEADVVAAVDHTVAASNVLDEIPPTCAMERRDPVR